MQIRQGTCIWYWPNGNPKKQAVYKSGHKALLDYLKENSKDETANVEKNQLKSGIIRFFISEDGQIKNAALESSSGYKAIDEKMIELITNLPENWTPATNASGNKIEQELIFSFGTLGC